MKKLFLSITLIASLSLVSCSDDAKKAAADAVKDVNAATTETTSTSTTPTATTTSDDNSSLVDKLKSCTDPAKLKEYAETAITKAKGLLESKQFAEAKTFLTQVGPTIKEKVPSLTSTVDQLINIANQGEQASQYVDQANQVMSGLQNIKL